MKATTFRLAAAAALAVALVAPAAAQKQGGDVVIAMTQAPPSLDPHASSAQVARNVNLHVFETLYARDENAKPVPDLAEGVTISPDGLTYVFALRKDVKFHNGKAMTADDVAASLERYRKGGASATLLGAIDSISASGPSAVTVKLKSVQSTFLGNLSSPRAPIAIMPAEEAAKAMGQASPIGTGPFKFVEYKPDSHVKIEKFADYKPNPAYKERDGFAGAKIVYVNSVTFRFIPEAGARNAAIESGAAHLNETADGPTAKRLKGNANFQVIPVLPFALQVVKFNHAQAPGSDANFRRAVALAIDPEEIMAVAYPDIYKLDFSWVYGGSPYHSDRGAWKRDLAAAKAALAQSGYKGEKLAFIVDNFRPNVDVATVLQQQLSQVGVNIELKVADWPTVSKVGFTDEGWNFWTHGFGIEPFEGPASVISPWVKGTSQRKADPIIDSQFEKINAEMTLDGQRKIFDEFQNHMAKEAVALNLGDYGLFQVASAKLKNFKPYRIPRMWGVWMD
jgi:peptide/nickel transport system substrate-binding protein